jgi:peptidoglycan hydrolase-like protein with peptidoglycan-binding domain
MTGKPVWRFLRRPLLAGLPLVATLAIALPADAQESPPKSMDMASWKALPIDDLRQRANAGDLSAMEELASRLVSGSGVPRDPQTAARWYVRIAEAGSPTAAFNLGVMYERGFGVERDSTRAAEWYGKAVAANVGAAKHNLALMLRDGRGVPQDGKRALELLRAAARQGNTASMFALGDIYERGDLVPKDLPTALAWFAIATELEFQASGGSETPLGKAAEQRGEVLQRILTPLELERGYKLGQEELQAIVVALQPKPEAPPPAAPTPSSSQPPTVAPDAQEAADWPQTPAERVRLIQQALIDLQRMKGKADGAAGPATRAAIRDFEKSAGLAVTGEPSREVYLALKKVPRDPQPDSAPWPSASADQIRAIQRLLVELKLMNSAPTGTIGPLTRRAIRDYQRTAGLKETGEPSQALFESLKESRAREIAKAGR